MKFIKTQDGKYFRVDKIIRAYICSGGASHAVCVFSEKRFATLQTFDTRKEAQAYLDKLIAELEELE